MPRPVASLIISTYKNVEFLNAVIKSVFRQTDRRVEIIISEDGECEHTKEFVSELRSPLPLRHLTQPDVGWRKNKALNRAILASTTDYLIFIDGDCMLHPRFIEFHLKFASDKSILAGKRVKLDPHTSALLLNDQLVVSQMNAYLLKNFTSLKRQKAKFIEEGIFINPRGPFAFIPAIRAMHQLKGCNMSFSKKAIYSINGFDEDYINPAIGEGIDLTWRFKMAGFRIKSLRNLAVQYHLHHKECWTEQVINHDLMLRKQKSGSVICSNGLIKTSLGNNCCQE